ncbi:triacylglycerol lipase OBL1-like [Carya illinoinensis]|uniref:Fungal lipase-type domain-containing protein n=2 Tax=Carya illinoinensis TaxID=32201 RepID=A0A8T1N7D8_CARIL|nr:triacylglycerol lipase OBL1-like [Carya illinoinensis]KAG6624643.1 hypothetical protein CIPAW_16G042500 [Carya illinoinensis]
MAPAYERQFCDHFMLLKPEDGSFYGLIRFLLFSDYSETSGFLHYTETDLQGDFWRRWYIFNSLLVQKLLLLFGKPLVLVGNMLKLWLNLLSRNGGFLKLFFKFFTGGVVRPDPSSATFTSVVGCLDGRVELDKSIRQGDRKYNASLAMMASKLSYENAEFVHTIIRDHWNMENLGFYNFWNDFQGQPSTQAIMFQDTKNNPNLIVVGFRGTDPFDPIALGIDVDLSWIELEGVGMAHSGFMKALGLQKDKGWPKEIEKRSDPQQQYAYYEIRSKLREILQKNERAKFIVTGHSLGGALAILFVTILAMHEEAWLLDKLEGVYTFGQPRVGNKQFGYYMKEKLKENDVRYLRYVYCNDIVPRVPYDDDSIFFEHFSPCLYYNMYYNGKVLGEEPNKNYFSPLWVIPKYLNAVLELIRSFIIPYIGGSDYKENWLMKMYRVLGLIIPGLAEHSLQDYVNITRLGSLPMDLQNSLRHRNSKVGLPKKSQ